MKNNIQVIISILLAFFCRLYIISCLCEIFIPGMNVVYHINCNIEDFIKSHEKKLTRKANYETHEFEVFLQGRNIVAYFSVYDRQGETYLSLNAIKQGILEWNLNGYKGRYTKILDGYRIPLNDMISIIKSFECELLDTTCSHRSPFLYFKILHNVWLYYLPTMAAGYFIIVFVVIAVLNKNHRTLKTVSILLFLFSLFPDFLYRQTSFDYSYITDFTSTTKWLILGLFYCLQSFPIGFAWLCNIAFILVLIRLSLKLRPVDIFIFSIGLILAIYPLINNGEICNFTGNDNKHVVEIAKLGLGYYLWLASMATMFIYLIIQYLKTKNEKQRHY